MLWLPSSHMSMSLWQIVGNWWIMYIFIGHFFYLQSLKMYMIALCKVVYRPAFCTKPKNTGISPQFKNCLSLKTNIPKYFLLWTSGVFVDNPFKTKLVFGSCKWASPQHIVSKALNVSKAIFHRHTILSLLFYLFFTVFFKLYISNIINGLRVVFCNN